ncbi:MAG: cation-transporting P-type ATPase, partial [Syntrophobacteraceae bacterium]|nr:cation-transporting P-type ATPase [Syntrophobacteraceae bacterium]
MVRVIHQLKGRARFEVPGLRRCRSLAAYLERELKRAPGMGMVSANALTGNVLVLFSVPLTPLDLATRIESIRHAFLESKGEEDSSRSESIGEASSPNLRSESSWAADSPRPATVKEPPEESRIVWHTVEPGEVLNLLETSYELGLSEVDFQRKWTQYGSNTLPGTLTRSLFDIVASQVNSLPVLLTGGAAALSFVTGGILEGLLVMGVAALNVAIGAFVEERAERTLSAVRESVDLRAQVLRDGRLHEVPFDLIVPGDVLELQSGCRIPADGRLIRSDLLSLDESALTGESVPVSKRSAPLHDGEIPITERSNMVYRGTLVVEGTGYAVVVATGADTVLGKLQNFLGEVFPPEASMVRAMRNIATHLLRLGMSACCVFAVLSLLRGHGLVRIIRESLSLMAASVPSGLSTIAVGAFAMGHGDLRRSRILVQRLRALGNLASTQVVCFDKTGTLTMNQMMARELRAGGRVVKIEAPSGDMENWSIPSQDPDISRLVELAALCNEATLLVQDGLESIEGSSTEHSLLQLAAMAGIDANALRGDYPLVHTTP